MKSLTEYIFEVSKKTAESAAKKANKEIRDLIEKFKDSKFKDEEILKQLQRRARQLDTFNAYIDDINNEAASLAKGQLKSIIEKWKDGVQVTDTVCFKPLFYLTSYYYPIEGGTFFGYDFKSRWDRNDSYLKWAKLVKEEDIQYSTLEVLTLRPENAKNAKKLEKMGLSDEAQKLKDIDDKINALNEELKKDILAIENIKFSYIDSSRNNGYGNREQKDVMFFTIEKNPERFIDMDGWVSKDYDYQFDNQLNGRLGARVYAKKVRNKKDLN